MRTYMIAGLMNGCEMTVVDILRRTIFGNLMLSRSFRFSRRVTVHLSIFPNLGTWNRSERNRYRRVTERLIPRYPTRHVILHLSYAESGITKILMIEAGGSRLPCAPSV